MAIRLRPSLGSPARSLLSLLGSCAAVVALSACRSEAAQPAPDSAGPQPPSKSAQASPGPQGPTALAAKAEEPAQVAPPVAATPAEPAAAKPAEPAAAQAKTVEPAAGKPAVVAAVPTIPVRFAGKQDSALGGPLVVHGRTIGPNEIKRFLCHSIGAPDVFMFKLGVMIRQELAKRREAGATEEELAKFGVSDEQLAHELEKKRTDFLLRYPDLDFPTEVARSEVSLDLYRDRLRQTMIFDKLFRPENPDEWPEITRAIILEKLGEGWIKDEAISYQTRLERQKKEGLEDIPEDDPIAVEVTRGTIQQELNNYVITHIDPDAIAANLPAGVPAEQADAILMLVENEPIWIEQVWSRIAPYVTPDQVDEAKRFLVMIALLERDLEPKGTLYTQAQFREWWPTTARNNQKYGYIEYLNLNEMLSSQVMGFPSLWAFSQYTRVLESYRRAIAAELAKDELLVAMLPMANQIAGAAKLNVNVILLSAYDFDHVKWKEGGWADAKQRALAVRKALDEGAEWKPTLELNSEFWDPPMPEMGNKPLQNFYFKGTFGDQQLTRGQLVSYLMESDYRIFLFGPSVSDHIFFEQKMGSIDGPFRGPKGYYISRLTGKTPPSKPLDLKEPVHRQIAEHYYLKNAINTRSQALFEEGVKSGQVSGVTLGGGYTDL